MSILLATADSARIPQWQHCLGEALPERKCVVFPANEEELSGVEYALVWKAPPGLLASLPQLKAIFSLGAGVDHILADPEVPASVPIVRLVDPSVTHEMVLYTTHWVLHFHGNHHRYAQANRAGQWRRIMSVPASERTIGILGYGIIGTKIAHAVSALGFPVITWKKSPPPDLLENADNVHYGLNTSFWGQEQLHDFLQGCDILVNLLPATAETKGIIGRRELAAMPQGSYIIHIGRGGTIDEQSLCAAIEDKQIESVACDVFTQEPLPQEHPFWNITSICITPHIAGQSNPSTATKAIAENIRHIEQGQAPYPLYDRQKGY